MNARRRAVPDGLPNRVYAKSGSYYWYPKGGRWIKLCRVDDGLRKMHERLAAEMKKTEKPEGAGNVPLLIDEYIAAERHKHRERGWRNYGNPVKADFADVNIDQIDAAYVVEFLGNHWPDKLSMKRSMRAFLTGFFQWCKERRYMTGENPCTGIRLSKPKRREVYLTDAHFQLIRAELASNPMMLCMVDLCYLTVQRSTEIRDLRWKPEVGHPNWVDRANGVIHFIPSKTRDSSGIAIDWPITPEIDSVLEIARTTGKVKSPLVVHTQSGQAWINTAAIRLWHMACERAGILEFGYTIRDIRAKALTDAKKAGYDMDALMVAAAHTDVATTKIYMKDRSTPLSGIHLQIPKSA